MTATPPQAHEIDPFSLTIAVQNLGPGISGNAQVALDIPTGVTVQSTDAPNWSCRQTTKQLICKISTLAIGAAPVITVTLVPSLGEMSMAFTATVSAPTTDLQMDNNTASLTVDNPAPLVARPAGGGFGCTVAGNGPTATSSGLWVLGLAVGALGLRQRRVRAVGGRLLGSWR